MAQPPAPQSSWLFVHSYICCHPSAQAAVQAQGPFSRPQGQQVSRPGRWKGGGDGFTNKSGQICHLQSPQRLSLLAKPPEVAHFLLSTVPVTHTPPPSHPGFQGLRTAQRGQEMDRTMLTYIIWLAFKNEFL